MRDLFKHCEICDFSEWRTRYQGKVRDGSFGNFSREDCLVARCSRCGADRLNEACCRDTVFYETEDYRHLIDEPDNEAISRAQHNFLVVANLIDCWPECLKGLSVAEIGCAGGHFLDQVSGTVRGVISIEPCSAYHESLRERGYSVYGFSNDAGPDCSSGIDFSFCFSVIEHVLNPRVFLEEARYLMSPGGVLVLSTPNCRDILMDLKEEPYRSFFYRTVHRWYFDADSLAC
ncbi:MAG: class I SAM-dependent methyltransferase [Deltaproteobacteria bacterium]|nr:class I SAM-dependent methyltransferase [Deltaproteobacteria bacterium]MBW2119199.1 class I SAM-dependent methyltransferase [Deltaproteobacteria bacterium]MBW2342560.1 class I SAM-dependent methyltransferase [Deltaproteobacteria bacterium]